MLEGDAQLCIGDSGAPILSDGAIVATVSFGNASCRGAARATRLDIYADVLATLDDGVCGFDGVCGERCPLDVDCRRPRASGGCAIGAGHSGGWMALAVLLMLVTWRRIGRGGVT